MYSVLNTAYISACAYNVYDVHTVVNVWESTGKAVVILTLTLNTESITASVTKLSSSKQKSPLQNPRKNTTLQSATIPNPLWKLHKGQQSHVYSIKARARLRHLCHAKKHVGGLLCAVVSVVTHIKSWKHSVSHDRLVKTTTQQIIWMNLKKPLC